jgi:creatinine amidohydrolase
MTRHFLFENLTWPEVANLDRVIPLVLPLGGGFSQEETAAALGFPSQLGWLPAIPYGWSGSGLEIPLDCLAAALNNLLRSQLEDGFKRVILISPSGVELSIAESLTLDRAEPWRPVDLQSEDTEKVVLIPIGQTEQHALHLPLNVDTICIEAVLKGTVAATPERSFCLPVFPYGVSTHRTSFAGTFNMGGREFEDFFLAVIDSLDRMGFKRMYLNSGHGGNVSFLVNVVKYAGERHPLDFIATTWLYLNGPEGVKSLEAHRHSALGGMGHACELETSLMLHLRPELVHMDRVVDEIDFIRSPSYYMDWNETGALAANPPWMDDTATGAYGAGSLATAEKGALWLEAAIQEKAGHVEEILFQHTTRARKRQS